ncbi:MAG: stage III sporulation protein AE [Oscillospiraceae bacterium]
MRRLLIFAALAALLTMPCLAADLFGEQAEAYGVGEIEAALPETARGIIGDAKVSDALNPEGFLSKIWGEAREKLAETASRGVKSAVAIVAVALLCGLAGGLAADGETPKYVVLGGVLGIAVIAAGDAGAFIAKGAQTLGELSDFSHALLPCMTAAAAAGGALTSAAAKYAATALFMDVFLTVANGFVLPLVYAYMAASVAAAALDSPALDSAAALIKWLCVSIMTLLTTAFTIYLAATGAVTGASDALVTKAAKTAISAALPVVGGIVSDAASTVVAGAGLVRNAVGVFGMAAVLCVCLMPFMALGAQYLLYKAAAALAGAFADKRIATLTGSLGGAFGMVLGLVGTGAVMLFFSILSLIKAVSG